MNLPDLARIKRLARDARNHFASLADQASDLTFSTGFLTVTLKPKQLPRQEERQAPEPQCSGDASHRPDRFCMACHDLRVPVLPAPGRERRSLT